MRYSPVSVRRNGELILSNIGKASDFFTRLRGLMFYRELPGVNGLLIYPCRSVHMFWMFFPLDLVFMDRTGIVVQIVENLLPNRVSPVVKNAYYVLEIEVGIISNLGIRCGDRLEFF